MADFLEERFSELIRYGSTWQDDFAVREIRSSNGDEYPSLIHPYPIRTFDISFMLDSARLWTELINVYHRAHGKYAGFRARCFDEYSTNGTKGTPTALDQPTLVLTATTRQLIKRYGTDKTAGTSGYSYRKLKKPVSGTVVVAKNGTPLTGGQFTVDTTTGIVTVPGALITDTITAGCEYDFAVCFASALPVGQDYPGWRPVESVKLRERLNP
ncbi:MAG TPA: DUF2460 domain-containing protein [Azonexus sp.]|nr:DUF2460 domain-containing protein [Azonexus sp.]